MNSHGSTFLIILDPDARRLIKRQKLSHPRFGVLHETGTLLAGSQPWVVSQHVSKVGKRQLDESPLARNADDNHKLHTAITAAISGKVGKGRARHSKLGHVVGMGPEVNTTEVRVETLSFFVLA